MFFYSFTKHEYKKSEYAYSTENLLDTRKIATKSVLSLCLRKNMLKAVYIYANPYKSSNTLDRFRRIGKKEGMCSAFCL